MQAIENLCDPVAKEVRDGMHIIVHSAYAVNLSTPWIRGMEYHLWVQWRYA